MTDILRMAELVGENEALRNALRLAVDRSMPAGGRWHLKPHVREGCVGCVIEDALAYGNARAIEARRSRPAGDEGA